MNSPNGYIIFINSRSESFYSIKYLLAYYGSLCKQQLVGDYAIMNIFSHLLCIRPQLSCLILVDLFILYSIARHGIGNVCVCLSVCLSICVCVCVCVNVCAHENVLPRYRVTCAINWNSTYCVLR